MSSDVLASLKWPADGWLWWLQITYKQRISWLGTYRHPWNLSCPSAHSQPEGRSEVPNLLHRSWARGSDLAIQVMSMMMALWSRASDTICSASPDMPEHIARCGSSSCSSARTGCLLQSTVESLEETSVCLVSTSSLAPSLPGCKQIFKLNCHRNSIHLACHLAS